MKEKFVQLFVKFQFLVYATILCISATVLESYLSGVTSARIDSDRVESVLHIKETKLDSILTFFQNEVEKGENFHKENSIWLFKQNLDYLKDEGFTVFVYEKDTLRFWTDNVVPAGRIFSQSLLNNTFANLDNAWYEIRTVINGDYRYVGLIFLKNKYNLKNKYLKNEFLPDFNHGPEIQISMVPVSFGMDIRDKDGKYVFTLVPTSTYDMEGEKFNSVGILYFLSLVMMLIFIYTVICRLAKEDGNYLKIISIIIGVVVVRTLMAIFKLPPSIYSLNFFDPEFFLGPGIFARFGDFIINSVVILAVVVYIFKLTEYNKVGDYLKTAPKKNLYTIWGFSLTVYFLFFGYLYSVTKQLIGHSKILFQLTNIIELDIYSISGIMILIILTAALIYTSVKMTSYFDYSLIKNLNKTLLISAGVGVVLFIVSSLIFSLQTAIALLYVCLILGASMIMHYKNAETSVYRYIFMVFLSAVFTCNLISNTTEQKIIEESKTLVTYPADERDQIAELLLSDISQKLPNDEVITDFLRISDTQQRVSKLRDYIQHQYFNEFRSKYNLSTKVFKLEPGELFADIDDDFVKAVEQHGKSVNATGFYFVDKNDGTISYMCPLRYVISQQIFYLCISLDSKPIPQELGYPELLMDNSVKPSPIRDYSYAKYSRSRKISQNGNYNYDLTDGVYIAEVGEGDTIATTKTGDYIHTIYRNGENTIVLSHRKLSISDFVTQFAYLFVTYITVLLIVLVIKMFLTNNTNYRYQIKTRLIFSITGILMLSFIFICIATAYINFHRFKEDNMKSIDEKVKSVYMELEHTCGDTTSFSTMWNPNTNSVMDEYLVQLSHIFFIDINLYGPHGQLIASSRPEIFRQGLISTRMNTTVLRQFVLGNKSNIIQDEKIGQMQYASAYIPFYNYKDNLMGYINLPYFTKPDVFKRELSNLIVSIINLYVVLMMLSIVVAVFVSERIVQPIKLIQHKMEKIELGKQHEKIEYDRKDELGQLVAEYNNMAEKLEESAKLLAQGERESAWREMAKQIAHEIKNPLTPMKLSIQFLMSRRSDAGFDGILEKVSNTLIQQIDTLSSIATGFSNFAKMPKPNEHPFNVVETLENVIQLFNNVDNMDITSDLGGYKEIIIVADKEQISRVFINLIKNATQAIPDGVRGKIHVTLECKEKLVIKIADNGCGIPDEIRGKLFTPSFTTKSSGSGLGLAMVKNIIINAKGDITFESEVGKGTTFIVTLPINKKPQQTA